MSSLIIVESPTKAKTITKFLGSGYLVRSSMGHIRDLPKSRIGVDIENNFQPKYLIPAKAKKQVAELKDALKKTDDVILATDEDREGEAIAWHLTKALGLDGPRTSKKVKRIVFHEITKPAIEKALENPRDIDMHLVDAQQARRVLDRLVGYELSPFLWKKIRYGLSAGRVQSVALRLIVEREREIEKFIKEEYWTLDSVFEKEGKEFSARLNKIGNKTLDKLEIKKEEEINEIIKNLDGAEYKVLHIESKEAKKNPVSPFTTSTLQQAASRKYGMSAKQTMMHAQKLYETGHITYMRTDSVNIAESALVQAKKVITEKFGENYSEARKYKTKSKGAQEAHEAIRPTNLAKEPEDLGKIDPGQKKIYDLIWRRTLASQMKPALYDQTSADISAKSKIQNPKSNEYIFRANGQVMKFDGFLKVYGRSSEDVELPKLDEGEILNFKELKPEQHFTQPPPRYTDASLVKTLEKEGIGRPSTYAPTLSTIQTRGYVEKEEKKYKPTEIGILVNDMLVEHFPKIVDLKFTSHIEESFDQIAEGKSDWVPVIKEFYGPFKENLDKKVKIVEQATEETEVPCPKCNKKMVIKFGRHGKFLMCPDKECGGTKPLPEEEAMIKQLEEKTEGEKCPECGKLMEVKRGRYGYFLGCQDYPTCKGIKKIENKTGFKCPKCDKGEIVERKSRGRGQTFYACNNYPDCKFTMSKKPENEKDLEEALEKDKERTEKGANKKTVKTKKK
ncbi:MAG: DNA topoisomerase I [Candidatus Yanofskybacteria bacterium CG10_big_fil_rev_8_21_14_0_10_36_16]|uniref:DNA topoisomerase 1 n=1 Tax=Candidatus Yanofskybacteria bacterium CG10_big_fil_rev_8_21_14_0_10_36_16 TaxID=1975096 RepID=A0A2J0QBS8_9BACT|nr:MAG: DNA topoisomerase I [Candidatus Yanofskybacteria bacterium CG10_big_fil_rev_8_21_14_0_10_36_16]